MPDPAEIVHPAIDHEALSMAGMAYIHSPGPTGATRVRDAITAYLYSVANVRDLHGMRAYPSWQEVRDYLAETTGADDA